MPERAKRRRPPREKYAYDVFCRVQPLEEFGAQNVLNHGQRLRVFGCRFFG
jgi:hypothetical protein